MNKLQLLRRLLDISEQIIKGNYEEYILKPLSNLKCEEYSDFVKKSFPFVMHMIICWAFRLSKGIWHLCNQGYADTALGLCRTLVELDITVNYIKQDEENRVERFHEHWYVGRKFEMDSFTLLGKAVPSHVRKEILNDYNRVKAKYKDFKDMWWSGKPPEQMAKDIRAPAPLRKLYGKLSTYVHSYVHVIDKFNKNGVLSHPVLTPSPELSDFAIGLATIYFIKLMKEWLDASGVSMTDELQHILDDVKSTYGA